MKRIIYSILTACCMFTACMAQDNKHINETRPVKDFTSIRVDGVGAFYFTQDDTYSLRIEGEEKEVKDLVTEVKDGTLTIYNKSKRKRKGTIQAAHIYLSAPRIERVDFDGVGKFACEKRLEAGHICFNLDGVGKLDIEDLHCQTAEINIDGVGKANIHLECETLNADIDGVGSAELSGKAKHAIITRDGIGRCDTSDLEVENLIKR